MTLDIDVLEQSKRNLHDKGWGQGELVCEGGKVCALGALHIALGAKVVTLNSDGLPTAGIEPFEFYDMRYPYEDTFGSVWPEFGTAEYDRRQAAVQEWHATVRPYEAALDEAVTQISNQAVRHVVDWNDIKAETVDDVIAVFDRAIENIKSEELVSV